MEKMPWLKTHWPAISFLIILGFAVAAQVIVAVEPGACYPNSLQYWSSEQKVPLFACWEFWLNRYQTILAAFIGAAVAIYVVRPVYRQLRLMTRQTSNDARAVTREILAELQVETKTYTALDSALDSIDFGFDFIGESPFDNTKANRELLEYIDKSLKILREESVNALSFRDHDPHDRPLDETRASANTLIAVVIVLVDATLRQITREMTGSTIETGINDRLIEIRANIKAAQTGLKWLIENRKTATFAERAEIRRLEREVRGK